MTTEALYRDVRAVTAPDRDAVAEVLAEAFHDGPVVCWLFPDPVARRSLLPTFFWRMITHPAAEPYLIGPPAGVAVWQSLGEGEELHDTRANAGADVIAALGEGANRLAVAGRALAERHPVDRAHLYLPAMGVTPLRRSAGLGSALLRHRLDRADTEGLGAYLEASSPFSRELYLRHGFEDHGPPIQLPEGPRLWPMWREPKP